MKKQWNILHFSDLHLHEPEIDDGPEHLRKKHFDEYIRDLARAVKNEIKTPIDCLAITGDLVNKGRFVNFDHAIEVIQFACKEFNLNDSQVVVCPGNHDLDKDDELNGKPESARSKFRNFESKWANGLAKCNHNNRAVLCELNKNLFALSIDSTLGAKTPFIPGPGAWSASESKDAALGWIKRKLANKGQLLVVLSHYPVEAFQESLIADEEEDFIAKHIWVKGKELASRIGRWREGAGEKTLWLSGDVHVEYRTSCYGIDFVTAGRLGTRAEKGDGLQPRQAKVIQISSAADIPTKVLTFNYKMPGNGMRNAGGKWSVESDSISTKNISSERNLRDDLSVGSTFVESITTVSKRRKVSGERKPNIGSAPKSDLTSHAIVGARGSNVEILDPELEGQIITKIAEKKLYSVGRFETNETDTSLSWVSIGPLLNTTGILPITIKAMHKWICAKLNQGRNPSVFEKTLFLGMDCWGAVLASQLSILSGAQNFCVASRGSGLHYTSHERISKRVIKKVKESRAVVLVHDVIGTGQSLQNIHKQVVSKLDPKEVSKISWFALSLICDNSRSRNDTCGFLLGHGTACGSLRMPILSKSQLPDERVLPPQLSFTLHKNNQNEAGL